MEFICPVKTHVLKWGWGGHAECSRMYSRILTHIKQNGLTKKDKLEEDPKSEMLRAKAVSEDTCGLT